MTNGAGFGSGFLSMVSRSGGSVEIANAEIVSIMKHIQSICTTDNVDASAPYETAETKVARIAAVIMVS